MNKQKFENLREQCISINVDLNRAGATIRLTVESENNRYSINFGTPEQLQNNTCQGGLAAGLTYREAYLFLSGFSQGVLRS
jgi:hypothetical protein